MINSLEFELGSSTVCHFNSIRRVTYGLSLFLKKNIHIGVYF